MLKRFMECGLWAALGSPALLPAQDVPPAPEGAQVVQAVSQTALLVVLVLAVLILIPIAIVVYKRFFQTIAGGEEQTAATPRDPVKLEQKGDWLSAAEAWEEKGELTRAAGLYEKGKDLARAAEAWELVGAWDKAIQLHLRSGGSLRAAAIYIKTGQYLEAAKLFRNKGDHLRAAQALEKYGNKIAAAREYAEAGQFARAAKLYKEEGLYLDAAQAFRQTLGESQPAEANLDGWYTYATFLLLAKETEKARTIYEAIVGIDPTHLKAGEKLRAIRSRRIAAAEPLEAPLEEAPAPTTRVEVPVTTEPSSFPGKDAARGVESWEMPSSAASPTPSAGPPGGEASVPTPVPPTAPQAAERPEPMPPPPAPTAAQKTLAAELDEGYAAAPTDPFQRITLRSMTAFTRLEPRYAMRLWVQMMKVLAARHREGFFYGTISPEQVSIDMQNNIRIEESTERKPDYTAPEVNHGVPPDSEADIYAMGVVLYEMVTGRTDMVGSAKPSELNNEVPPWMDDLIGNCVQRDRRYRFRGVEQISAAILKLKSNL